MKVTLRGKDLDYSAGFYGLKRSSKFVIFQESDENLRLRVLEAIRCEAAPKGFGTTTWGSDSYETPTDHVSTNIAVIVMIGAFVAGFLVRGFFV